MLSFFHEINVKFILFLILTNILFVISSFYLGLGRPLINLDYIVIYALLFLRKPYLLLIGFVLFFVYFIDILLMVLQIFPFIRLTDLVYLSNFIFNGPILYRLILILSVVNLVFTLYLIVNIFKNKIEYNLKNCILYFVFFLVLSAGASVLNDDDGKSIYSRFEKTIINSQILFFYTNRSSTFVESFNSPEHGLEPSKYDFSTKYLFEKLNENKLSSKKILLIVNESWGESYHKVHQDKVLEPIYTNIEKLSYVEQGSFNFIGATVAGELRELCNKQPTSFNLKETPEKEFEDCLPHKLKALDYNTYAIHGAMSLMYDRYSWYPKAGFDKSLFFENLSDVEGCKAFNGKCDSKILPSIKRILNANNKVLVYWLTLNTHAPYDEKVYTNDFDCKMLNIKENSESCNNFRLQHQFFLSVSSLIHDESLRGLEVIVVGDHSPPIFNMVDNFFSYKGTEVAWIKFKIK